VNRCETGSSEFKAIALLFLLARLTFGVHYDGASVAARWAIDLYRAHISPLQGRHVCNFEPTCSQFSKQAIDRYGLGLGVLMTADRLERCNPYAQYYLGSYYQGVTDGRMNDPVADHEFGEGSGDRGQGTGKGIADCRSQTANYRMETTQSAVPEGLAFADYLFGKSDYRRAIGEYERFVFEDTSAQSQAYARLMIGESEYRLGDFVAANGAFRDAIGENDWELAYLGMARSLLELGRGDAARHYALVIRDSALLRPATVVAACGLYRRYDFAAGAQVMRRLGDDSVLDGLQSLDGRDVARRNPALSAVLSTVIPGLGQTYCGRPGDGVFSFAVVATAAAASYYYWTRPGQDPEHIKFAIVAGLGTVFHLGNIYGAAIAGRDYNRLQKRNYLARIEDILHRVNLQPNYREALSQ
jgi:putative component of membrane protein insertase Oxa1/YidC/SpoIIIJ protein YidD